MRIEDERRNRGGERVSRATKRVEKPMRESEHKKRNRREITTREEKREAERRTNGRGRKPERGEG